MVHTNVLMFLEKCVNSSIKHFFLFIFIYQQKVDSQLLKYWWLSFMYQNILLRKEAAIVTYQPYRSCRLLQVQRKCNKYFNFKNRFPESRERKSLWLRRLSQNVQPHFGIFFYSPLWYRSLLDRNASWNSKQRETQRYSPAGYEKSECAACWCCLLMPQFPFVLRHH